MEIVKLENKKDNIIGSHILLYDELDSTQEEAKRKLKTAKDGTVIIADNQLHGRGTHGRRWYTEKGSNITMSIILFPDTNINKLKNITIDIAKVIVNTINNLYNYKLDISYPNDIILNGKKIGGILTNISTQGDVAKNIIIGIGLNINQTEFPSEISNLATSLKKEYGVELKKEKIIEEICINLEDLYKKIKK